MFFFEELGLIATLIVLALSCAEIPVVIPFLDSIDTVKAVDNVPRPDDWFSAAIASDGSYDVPEGLIFGYPLKSNGQGKIEIVQNIELNDIAKSKIKITTEELLSEKAAVEDLLT